MSNIEREAYYLIYIEEYGHVCSLGKHLMGARVIYEKKFEVIHRLEKRLSVDDLLALDAIKQRHFDDD